jgi:hypothetical protein
MIIFLFGKYFFADKHFPWTNQKSYEWNMERGKKYIMLMLELKKKNMYPYDLDNITILQKVNEYMQQLEVQLF